MRIVLVGDVMLGRLVNEVLQHEPPAYPWGDTLPLFQKADFRLFDTPRSLRQGRINLALGNLEGVLADQGVPWSVPPKGFHFRSDAKNLQVLHAAQITAVSLANNHVLDCQEAALFEMLRLLDEQGILRVGAGHTLAEAAQPALSELDGQHIGLIAFTDNEPFWEATEQRPGVYYVPLDVQDQRAKRLFERVSRLKLQVDVLIVSAHWGGNWGALPPAAHPPYAHALIEAGADLVFGHSGHVLRGANAIRDAPSCIAWVIVSMTTWYVHRSGMTRAVWCCWKPMATDSSAFASPPSPFRTVRPGWPLETKRERLRGSCND